MKNKESTNPLTRWTKTNEVVAAALKRATVGPGGSERDLPPEVAHRITKAVSNGKLPTDIADLCTLTQALEEYGINTTDVEDIHQAARGSWQMRILAASAGKGT
tara:strand:- start:4911 stop:5222 length:312 start_codon:yes stop_codon:yes gene_type:complete